jgi:3-oxoadipate enol-lactonase
MEWLERDGVGLRYEVSGAGEHTLVLVHEMGSTLEGWDLIMPLLAPGSTRLRIDMRGAGLSSKWRGVGRISDQADDIAAVLEAAGRAGQVTIVGGAVGGAIALHFAARFPQRTNGVIALGPATFIPPERQQAILDYADHVERVGIAAVAESELARSYPDTLRGDAKRFRRFRARWLANDPGSYAATYRMLAGLDMTGDLALISCPALLLAGHADPLRPPELVETLSRQIAGARFKAIASGHFAATQTPELVAAEINAFTSEIWAR